MPMIRFFFFLCKYLGYHMYKPIPIEEKFKKLKTGFWPAVPRSRLEQKAPVTESLVCCVCVLFSMAKFMPRMGSCIRFVAVE